MNITNVTKCLNKLMLTDVGRLENLYFYYFTFFICVLIYVASFIDVLLCCCMQQLYYKLYVKT